MVNENEYNAAACVIAFYFRCCWKLYDVYVRLMNAPIYALEGTQCHMICWDLIFI